MSARPQACRRPPDPGWGQDSAWASSHPRPCLLSSAGHPAPQRPAAPRRTARTPGVGIWCSSQTHCAVASIRCRISSSSWKATAWEVWFHTQATTRLSDRKPSSQYQSTMLQLPVNSGIALVHRRQSCLRPIGWRPAHVGSSSRRLGVRSWSQAEAEAQVRACGVQRLMGLHNVQCTCMMLKPPPATRGPLNNRQPQ